MAGPVARTLTRGQYQKTAAGKRDNDYASYLSYVAKRRAANMAAMSADPLGQTSPGEIQQTVKSIVGKLPPPLTNQQIQTQAAGVLDPVVQRITQGLQAQGRSAANTIGGYTGALSSDLAKSAPAGVTAAYAPAEQATAAANAALADRVQGAGVATSDDLARRLASINDPTVAATTGQVASDATGAGNAAYATGNASLEAMLANHAADSAYAGKLPGIVDLGGVQQVGQAQGALNKQLGDQLTQVESQLPSIVQSLRSSSDTNATNRAQLASSLYEALTGQNITKATAKAGLVTDANTQTNENARAQATIDSENARAQAQIDAANYRAQLAADARKKKQAKKPSLTPKQVQDYKGTAATLAVNARDGFTTTDKTGVATKHPAISEAMALQEARKEGIPDSISIPVIKKAYSDVNPATNPRAKGPVAPGI